MPRYLVQRSFPGGLAIPANEAGDRAWSNVIQQNVSLGVTWLHSYVSADLETMFCVYDAPDPSAIRQAADRTGLPLGRITLVTVLEPYRYMGPASKVAPSDGHETKRT